MANISTSIIVPVYNAKKYLNRCIDSIISQTLHNFELIIVDDGSNDNSCEICDEYAAKDSRIIVIHKTNGGVSSARNAGLEMAKNETIIFVDADDFLSPDYIEKLLYYSENDMVIGGYMTTPSCRKISLTEHLYLKDGIKDFINSNISRLYFTVPWGKLYKKQIISQHHLRFDTNIRLAEDLIFNLDYLLYCNSIKTINSCNYIYEEGNTTAEGKYSLKREEIEYTLERCEVLYRQLEKKYNITLSRQSYRAILSCYPIHKIFEEGNDKEYVELYKKYADPNNINDLYNDIICSPANKTIYAIISNFRIGDYKKTNFLINSLYNLYKNKVKCLNHPNIIYRLIYSSILHQRRCFTFILLKIYLATNKIGTYIRTRQ